MRRLNNEECMGIALTVENGGTEMKLKDKDRKLLNKISKYIRTFPLSELEIEEVRKELIGIANQAEMRGESLQEAIGTNYKAFCNEMIKAITDIDIPPKWGMMRITGTLLMIESGLNFFVTIGYSLFLVLMFSGVMKDLGDEAVLSYLVGRTILLGSLYWYAGAKGRRQCGSPKAADTCFKCGVLLLVLEIGIYWFEVSILGTRWDIIAEGTLSEYVSILGIILVLLLYTMAAWENRKKQ